MRWRPLLMLALLPVLGCNSCENGHPTAVETPAGPTTEATPSGYLRVASGLDPVHTLDRWLLLVQAGQADGVLLAPYIAGDVTIVVPADMDSTRLLEIASRFGDTAVDIDVDPSQLLHPSLVQTTEATRIFAAPGDERPVRIVPAHAIILRLDGPLPGLGATPDDWVWGAITRTDGGYLRADALTPYEGCVPTPERFLADLPTSDGHSHEVRATISRVRVSFDGTPHDAFLFASQDRHEDEVEEEEDDEEAEGKHGAGVGVYPTDAHCELSEGFAWSFGHVVEQVDVVEAGDGQPSLLSLVLSEGAQELEAKLFRVGHAEALVERDLAVGSIGPWPPLSSDDANN